MYIIILLVYQRMENSCQLDHHSKPKSLTHRSISYDIPGSNGIFCCDQHISQYGSSLAGHTLSQERVWYFTMQRFVPDPTTFVGCFPPNMYVVCVLRDRVYTLQPLSARTISCTVTYQTLS